MSRGALESVVLTGYVEGRKARARQREMFMGGITWAIAGRVSMAGMLQMTRWRSMVAEVQEDMARRSRKVIFLDYFPKTIWTFSLRDRLHRNTRVDAVNSTKLMLFFLAPYLWYPWYITNFQVFQCNRLNFMSPTQYFSCFHWFPDKTLNKTEAIFI